MERSNYAKKVLAEALCRRFGVTVPLDQIHTGPLGGIGDHYTVSVMTEVIGATTVFQFVEGTLVYLRVTINGSAVPYSTLCQRDVYSNQDGKPHFELAVS